MATTNYLEFWNKQIDVDDVAALKEAREAIWKKRAQTLGHKKRDRMQEEINYLDALIASAPHKEGEG